MSFLQDLQDGNNIEDEFSDYLKSNLGYIYTAQVKGKCKDCDIIAKQPMRHWETFEIKHDKKFIKTGNICIELQCSNKASGIMRTISDYIVYRLGDEWYICLSQALRQWLWENENKYKILKGGDGWRSELALLPLNTFKIIFNKI